MKLAILSTLLIPARYDKIADDKAFSMIGFVSGTVVDKTFENQGL